MNTPYKKITHGWVEQSYDKNGKCYRQEFFAGDIVTWEDKHGPIHPLKYTYQPFTMMQPKGFSTNECKCPCHYGGIDESGFIKQPCNECNCED